MKAHKPYTTPKLLKLDTRCVNEFFSNPMPHIHHVADCSCEGLSDAERAAARNVAEDDSAFHAITRDETKRNLPVTPCSGSHCRGKNAAKDDHTCPYAEDVNDDAETMCNCCDVCTEECANDI